MNVDGIDDPNPYQAPQSSADPRPTRAARHRLAGRIERLLASILDTLVYFPSMLCLALGNAAQFLTDDVTTTPDRAGTVGLLLAGFSWLVVFGLQLFLLCTRGATLGKRILKLRVVGVDGRPAGVVQLVLLRSLIPALFGFCCGIFSLIDALFIFGEERRCLHDLLAGTVVVNA